MARAVRYHKQGGPEVMQLDEVEVGDPGKGQVRIRHTAIGVNLFACQRDPLAPPAADGLVGEFTPIPERTGRITPRQSICSGIGE